MEEEEEEKRGRRPRRRAVEVGEWGSYMGRTSLPKRNWNCCVQSLLLFVVSAVVWCVVCVCVNVCVGKTVQ